MIMHRVRRERKRAVDAERLHKSGGKKNNKHVSRKTKPRGQNRRCLHRKGKKEKSECRKTRGG